MQENSVFSILFSARQKTVNNFSKQLFTDII